VNRTTLTLLFALGLVACGGAPPPNDQVAASQAAIRAAEEAGGDRNPEAQLYLKLARESLEKAKALMEQDNNEAALRLLKKSEADADLSRQLARKVTAENEAEEAKQVLSKLKPATN
jgi:hypothetical protein